MPLSQGGVGALLAWALICAKAGPDVSVRNTKEMRKGRIPDDFLRKSSFRLCRFLDYFLAFLM
jgi:hypothetical protein